MLTSKRFRLGRSSALGFLNKLASVQDEAVTIYISREMPQVKSESLLLRILGQTSVPVDMVEAVARSQTGAAVFKSAKQTYLVLPPFPIVEEYVANGYDVEPLYSLLSRDYLMALVLVRLGAYSIGICRGTQLIDSKTGTGLVHARHKKGGSSQARFARHREKQIEQFLGRVCSHVREHIEPHARALDYLVYGGARSTISLLRKQCPFLNQFDDRVLRMLLDIPEPRQAVMEKAILTVWSSEVMEWREQDSDKLDDVPVSRSFHERLLYLNNLDSLGFKEWIFHPAMLFGSLQKWWGDLGQRQKSHEGLDMCLYRTKDGKTHYLPRGTKVPAIFAGRVMKVSDDFLGKSVFVSHSVYNPNGSQLYTVYGHIEPERHIRPGYELGEGDVLGVLADTEKSGVAVPPHLHISVAWAAKPLAIQKLGWETLGNLSEVTLVDPLSVIQCPYSIESEQLG